MSFWLVWAILTFIVGFWLVLEPHNGTLTLTIVLGIYFLFMGLTRVAVALSARGQRGAGLVALSGIAGLLIGILVLAKLPSSADWAIGLLVGIDLIFAGWTLVSVALVGKDLSAPESSHSCVLGRASSGHAPKCAPLAALPASLDCLTQAREGWRRKPSERSEGPNLPVRTTI